MNYSPDQEGFPQEPSTPQPPSPPQEPVPQEPAPDPTPTPKTPVKEILGFLKETAGIILVSFLIVIPIRYYLIQPFIVKGASMEPNFHNGEYLIVNEIKYRFEDPQREDVIVFKYPNDPKEYYIKRIVGLPGETLRISNNQITIFNSEHPRGFILEEDYLSKEEITQGELVVELGKDEYFVLGDNRSASSDSRIWGTLPRDLIIGKTWIRAYPFDKITLFQD